MLRAVIIDDEENSSNSLREKLRQHFPAVELVAVCDSGAAGIEAIDTLHPDLVFLDVEMPRMNGFTMLRQVAFKGFALVFTTAYDHYAIKAIRYSALDYLVKPIEIDELRLAVERAEEKQKEKSGNQLELLLENLKDKRPAHQRIAIPTVEGLQFIKVADIVYLEAQVNYTHIYLQSKNKYVVCRTLKEFEDMLPADTFLRIHHSHIINKNFAERYVRGEGGQVVLSNGVVLDIAKRRKAEFMKAIGY